MNRFSSLAIRCEEDGLKLLDQSALPFIQNWIAVAHPTELMHLFQQGVVRGDGLLGVAAATSLALLQEEGATTEDVIQWAEHLKGISPAVQGCVEEFLGGSSAEEIFAQEQIISEQLSDIGAAAIEDGASILTYGNSGGLVTTGPGIGLGPILRAHQQQKRLHVYVSETRPQLFGARLTCWELLQAGIPHTLICDNVAAHLMAEGDVSQIFLGADAIALNGDVICEAGSYSLAVIAQHHHIPLNVVASTRSIDLSAPTGEQFAVLECDPSQVRGSVAPAASPVYNPAADTIPANLVSHLILETGRYTAQEQLGLLRHKL